MSNMGRFVFECQQIAMNAESVAEVKEQCKKDFAERNMVDFATETAVEYYGQLQSDPYGSVYEDIPF